MTKTDKSSMFNLIVEFPRQLKYILHKYKKIEFSPKYRKIDKILISGMGGSAVTGDIIKSILIDTISIPVFVNRNYGIPKFTDSKTLTFIISYSGNTEETLSAYESARKSGAKIICITSGGKLAEIAEKNKDPFFIIPSGQPPRASLGYMLALAIIILNNLKISDLYKDLDETIKISESLSKKCINKDNTAKKLAKALQNKLIIIAGVADFTDTVAFRWKTQFNENSKVIAYPLSIPEMTHNEIVAWGNQNKQENILNKSAVIFLRDKNESFKIKRRIETVKKLFSKKTKAIYNVHSVGKSKLARIVSLIYFGDFVSFYLSMFHRVDPTPIPAIDFLKKCLK